jgi:hypothetical protein
MATTVAGEPDDATEPLAALPAPRPAEALPSAGAQGPAAPAPAGPAPGGPPAGRRLPSPATVFRGAARSLFVTPWFAAATGFVIAAGLWVYSPHTVLRFPNSVPGLSICKSAGCVQDSDPEGGSLAVVSPGVKISDSKASAKHTATSASGHANNAVRGLTFKFTVLWQRQNGFGAEVTVSGHQVPGSWRLSFDLPGAQIAYVGGVTWQANAAGTGGTASALSWQDGGDRGDGADGGGTGDQDGPGAGRPQPGAAPVISFLITASGPQAAPVHCVFDHATCRFR